jgi:myo-inositol-1(or 4)-monophosphatase
MMSDYLDVAIRAAREAGALLRANFGASLKVDSFEAHDIKLELDVRTQQLITDRLLAAFPDHAIFGEEGIAGNQAGPFQWIVDPIDGTVNFFYGLPHFCISIALRTGTGILLGVIYDPMRDELWQVEKGGAPLMNGRPVAVSQRDKLGDAFVSVGFSKNKTTINAGLPLFEQLIHRVRKCRLMGSAALDMAYVASGRLDAYIESQVSLWDVAAGILLVEAAGGKVVLTPIPGTVEKYSISATSGRIDFTA